MSLGSLYSHAKRQRRFELTLYYLFHFLQHLAHVHHSRLCTIEVHLRILVEITLQFIAQQEWKKVTNSYQLKIFFWRVSSSHKECLNLHLFSLFNSVIISN